MQVLTANLVGRVRHVTVAGKEWLVAPMTLLVSGVLSGSKGALYYPPDEIANTAGAWEHIPITIYHPTQNGIPVSASDPGVLDVQGVGYLKDPVLTGDRSGRQPYKLKATGWFDVEQLRRVDPRVLMRLEQGNPLELSTGLFTDNERVPPGTVSPQGRPYDYVARHYRPDHLAVLPDQVGACSVNDGCGVLVNHGTTTNAFDPEQMRDEQGRWTSAHAAALVKHLAEKGSVDTNKLAKVLKVDHDTIHAMVSKGVSTGHLTSSFKGTKRIIGLGYKAAGEISDPPTPQQPVEKPKLPTSTKPSGGNPNEYGKVGANHPLAGGKSREEQTRVLGEMRQRADRGTTSDPMKLEGGVPGLDKKAFDASVVHTVSKHASDTHTDMPLDKLYHEVAPEHGLSKHDFLKAMTSLHFEDKVRMGTWSGPLDRIPDPELASVIGSKVMYDAHIPVRNQAMNSQSVVQRFWDWFTGNAGDGGEGFDSDEQRKAFFGLKAEHGGEGKIGKSGKSSYVHPSLTETMAAGDASGKKHADSKSSKADELSSAANSPRSHDKAATAHDRAALAHKEAAAGTNDSNLRQYHDDREKYHDQKAEHHRSLTGNAGVNQPRHPESGQFLPHGAGTGKGDVHGAAQQGHGTGQPGQGEERGGFVDPSQDDPNQKTPQEMMEERLGITTKGGGKGTHNYDATYNAWTDEARAASIEARRKLAEAKQAVHDHAAKSSTIEDKLVSHHWDHPAIEKVHDALNESGQAKHDTVRSYAKIPGAVNWPPKSAYERTAEKTVGDRSTEFKRMEGTADKALKQYGSHETEPGTDEHADKGKVMQTLREAKLHAQRGQEKVAAVRTAKDEVERISKAAKGGTTATSNRKSQSQCEDEEEEEDDPECAEYNARGSSQQGGMGSKPSKAPATLFGSAEAQHKVTSQVDSLGKDRMGNPATNAQARDEKGRWVSGGGDTSSLPETSPAHVEADHASLERVMGKGEHVHKEVGKLLEGAGEKGITMRQMTQKLNRGGSVYGNITPGHVKASLEAHEVSYKGDKVRLSKHDEGTNNAQGREDMKGSYCEWLIANEGGRGFDSDEQRNGFFGAIKEKGAYNPEKAGDSRGSKVTGEGKSGKDTPESQFAHQISKVAAQKSEAANKEGASPHMHEKAASAHTHAAQLHAEAGNTAMAEGHQKAAMEHAFAHRKATMNSRGYKQQVTRNCGGNGDMGRGNRSTYNAKTGGSNSDDIGDGKRSVQAGGEEDEDTKDRNDEEWEDDVKVGKGNKSYTGNRGMEQWLASMPEEARGMWNDMRQASERERTQLIGTLAANSSGDPERVAQWLGSKPTSELRKMMTLLPQRGGPMGVGISSPSSPYQQSPALYGGVDLSVNAESQGSDDLLELPTINWSEWARDAS